MASLPQVQQYISTRYYDSSGKSTDVHVTGISDKALSGIVHAMQVHQALLKNVEASINNNGQQTSDLAAEIAENNEERRKRDEHARVDQLGQQRVHRAEQDILTGQLEDIKSGIDNVKDIFKSVFDSLTNILKDNFKRVMKAYDDFSATMRKKNMSTEDKNLAHLLTDKAFLKTSELGLNVSENQIREFLMGSVNIGDFKKLSDTQLALAAQMKTSGGLDERTILHIIRTAKNEDELKTFVLRMTDRFSAESQGKVYEEIFKKHGTAANAVMWNQYGGNSAAMMKDLQNTTRELTRLTSGSLTSEDIAELVTTSFLAQNGQIQELDNKLVSDMLVAAGQSGFDGGQSLVNFFKDNLSMIQGSDFNSINNQLLALAKNGDVSRDLVDHLSNLFMQVRNNGLAAIAPDKANSLVGTRGVSEEAADTISDILTDAQLRENNRVNKQDGQFFDWVNRGIASVNVALKGSLSSVSTFLDELFGGAISTGDVVADGFKNVLAVLNSIRLGLLAGKFNIGGKLFGKLSDLVSGIGGKLSGIFGKLSGLLGAAGPFALAAAGVGAAVVSIKDTIDKFNAVEEADNKIKATAQELAHARERLDVYRKLNDKENIAKYEAKIKEIEARMPALQQTKSAAEYNAMSTSQKAAHDFNTIEQLKVISNIREINEINRIINDNKTKNVLSDKEISKYQNDIKLLESKNDELRNISRTLNEEANNFIPIMFRMNADQMLQWHDFKEGVSKFFSREFWDKINQGFQNNVNNAKRVVGKFFLEDVPNWANGINAGFQSQVDNAKATVGKLFSNIGDFFKEHIGKPISDVYNRIVNWFAEAFDSVGKFFKKIKDSFVEFRNKVKEFFSLKWVPEPARSWLGVSDSKPVPEQTPEQKKEQETREQKNRDNTSKARKGLLEKYDVSSLFSIAETIASSDTEAFSELNNTLKSLRSSKDSNGNTLSDEQIKSFLVDAIRVNSSGGGYDGNLGKFLTSEEFNSLLQKAISQPVPIIKNAHGGVYDNTTATIIGEAGKEAVLPLERQSDLRVVISKLNSDEKLNLLHTLLGNNILSYTSSSFSSDNISAADYNTYAEDNLKEKIRQVLNEAGLSDKLDEFSNLYNEAIKSVVASVSAESTQYAKQYAKHALSMMSSGDKDQIITALKEIISYLSGIAKSNTVSRAPAQRLPNNVFGR